MSFLETLGRYTIGIFHQLGAVILLLIAAVKEIGAFRGRETMKQCLALGVLSFPIVALTLLFTGMVLSVQIAGELTKYGADFTVGAIVAIGMGRELGPVLCGVVLAGRVGAAITAEIGTMRVTEQIDAFTKLKFESEFQRLSPGGAISYVEVPNMQDNLEAVMSVLQFIYDNIMYAELNTKSDYCQCCGYDGEIKIVEDDGKLVWECPKCGNRDQNKLNVARRTCGYIGTQFWNQGRTQEIKDRVLHL